MLCLQSQSTPLIYGRCIVFVTHLGTLSSYLDRERYLDELTTIPKEDIIATAASHPRNPGIYWSLSTSLYHGLVFQYILCLLLLFQRFILFFAISIHQSHPHSST